MANLYIGTFYGIIGSGQFFYNMTRYNHIAGNFGEHQNWRNGTHADVNDEI